MKPSIINTTLFLLVSFTIQTFCSSGLQPPSAIENSGTSYSGEIQIQRDPDGLFINVDLADSSPMANDTVKMILSLSDSGVLLVDSCLNFNQYPCGYYHCSEFTTFYKTDNYLNFNASTIQASAAVSLDSEYWELQEPASVARSCATNSSKYLGTGRYGILGLGTEGSSASNFLKQPLFSVYMYSDFQGGVLKFANDHLKYANGSLLGSLPAYENWTVPIFGGMMISHPIFSNPGFQGNLVFDINADVLGMPLDLFNKVMYFMALCQWPTYVVCSNDTYQPTCNYTGYVKNLPDITLSTGDLGVRFKIPVDLYLKDFKSREDFVNSVTLNFKALDPSLSGESYVTPEYANTIIMDGRSMSKYYFIFDATSGSNNIQVYPANPNATHSKPKPQPTPKDPNHKWLYIAGAGMIFVVIITVCCILISRRIANNKIRRALSSVSAIKEPLAAGAVAAEDNYNNSDYNYKLNKDLHNDYSYQLNPDHNMIKS